MLPAPATRPCSVTAAAMPVARHSRLPSMPPGRRDHDHAHAAGPSRRGAEIRPPSRSQAASRARHRHPQGDADPGEQGQSSQGKAGPRQWGHEVSSGIRRRLARPAGTLKTARRGSAGTWQNFRTSYEPGGRAARPRCACWPSASRGASGLVRRAPDRRVHRSPSADRARHCGSGPGSARIALGMRAAVGELLGEECGILVHDHAEPLPCYPARGGATAGAAGTRGRRRGRPRTGGTAETVVLTA